MKPGDPLAQQYLHVPACLKKFPPPTPPTTTNPSILSVQNENLNPKDLSVDDFSGEETCEQKVHGKINRDLGVKRIEKAKALGLNGDSVTFLDEEDEGGANMIVCSMGNCKFLNTHFVLGVANKHLGDGDYAGEAKSSQIHQVRPRDEAECNANGDKSKPSSKKVSFI